MGLLFVGHSALLPALFRLVWWDQRSHRLPDSLTLPALGASALWVMVLAVSVDPDIAQRAGLAFALSVLGLWLLAEAPGRPLGFGDVKLGAVLGMHLGVHAVELVGVWLAVAFISGGIRALWGLATGEMSARDHLAFGPHLTVGWMVTVAVVPG